MPEIGDVHLYINGQAFLSLLRTLIDFFWVGSLMTVFIVKNVKL